MLTVFEGPDVSLINQQLFLIDICLWLQWVDDIGGIENLGKKLLGKQKDEKLPVFVPPEVSTFKSFLFWRKKKKKSSGFLSFRDEETRKLMSNETRKEWH